ncbi:MAG: hypothetical protein HC790_08690 [Acaryochloridaceae cyanobacterium CSU_3_4]|nr:hypothetical protein [Acaryochloridaceae cyanobacterium CSU_3_4]
MATLKTLIIPILKIIGYLFDHSRDRFSLRLDVDDSRDGSATIAPKAHSLLV